MQKISFASDNYSGIHPTILAAIDAANEGYFPAYGDDFYTRQAVEKFKEYFGRDCEVFFVFNGTGANVTALQALNHSYEAVICANTAHIQSDECGAPEKFIGCKLLLVETPDGKLTVESIKMQLKRLHDQHHVQPRTISISQTSEYGTLYTPSEIQAIADLAKEYNLYLHMDGARIANAVAALNCDLATITKEVGVDVLSFGGTKNGMMLGEAVIFFNSQLAKNFLYVRKQGMQLASKMRFISAQFTALLTDNLWQKNAKHANDMAKLMAEKLMKVPNVKLTQKVEANALFAIFPQHVISKLQEEFYFYVWNESTSEVRLMTSFNTTEKQIDDFVKELAKWM